MIEQFFLKKEGLLRCFFRKIKLKMLWMQNVKREKKFVKKKLKSINKILINFKKWLIRLNKKKSNKKRKKKNNKSVLSKKLYNKPKKLNKKLKKKKSYHHKKVLWILWAQPSISNRNFSIKRNMSIWQDMVFFGTLYARRTKYFSKIQNAL